MCTQTLKCIDTLINIPFELIAHSLPVPLRGRALIRQCIHVGAKDTYLALYSGTPSDNQPTSSETGSSYKTVNGLNNIGIVVDDLDNAEKRVEAAGFLFSTSCAKPIYCAPSTLVETYRTALISGGQSDIDRLALTKKTEANTERPYSVTIGPQNIGIIDSYPGVGKERAVVLLELVSRRFTGPMKPGTGTLF